MTRYRYLHFLVKDYFIDWFWKKMCQVYFTEYKQQIGNLLDIRIKELLLKMRL